MHGGTKMNFDQEEKKKNKKRESAMFRLEYPLMQEVEKEAEEKENNISMAIRVLIRQGIECKKNHQHLKTKNKEYEEHEEE